MFTLAGAETFSQMTDSGLLKGSQIEGELQKILGLGLSEIHKGSNKF